MKGFKNIWFYSVMIFVSLDGVVLTAQTDTICFNDTILYTIPGQENSVYDWMISGGSVIYASIPEDSVIVVWNESPGLHAIEVTRSDENYCSSEPERLEVYVYQPVIDLGDYMDICDGSTEWLVLEPDFEEYFWNGQPGTNEFEVSTEGIVNLEVKDKYGCWAGDSIFVIEKMNPEPDFTVNADIPNRTVYLTNNSDSTWHYYWDFGDGSYSNEYNPGIHTYIHPGSYEITLTASNDGCSGSVSQVIGIAESLLADFTAVYEGCAPVEVTFINQSTGADSYYWDFGNGKYSTAEDPVVLYSEAGIYKVSLYAIRDTISSILKKTIIVNKAPVAAFVADPPETTIFNDISFINESSDAVYCLWDFGDGETSSLYEPSHRYSSSGLYDVSLSVWSEAGCFDSVLINNAVTVRPDCRMLFPNGFIPNKNGPGEGYYDPAQITDNNEIFHPIYENIETYELKIYNRWGELIFISRNIDIGWDGYYKGKLAPQDTYIYQAKAICSTGQELSTIGSVTLIH
jgi:gliding motility-associated-like protein